MDVVKKELVYESDSLHDSDTNNTPPAVLPKKPIKVCTK